MAEGRMLKRNISESRRLAQLKTDSARLLWTWIIPFLDSEGRFYASPDMIKGKIVPRISSFTEKNIPEYINEMAEVGLITLYAVDGELLLQFRKFETFQKIKKDREATPLPGPDKGEEVRIESGSNQDLIGSKSGLPCSNLNEVNLRETKLREVESESGPVDNQDQNPAFLKTDPQPDEQKEPDALMNELREVTEEIGTLMPEPFKQRQMMTFVEANIRKGNHNAILDCLKSMLAQLRQGEEIKNPRAYLEAAMKIEDGKHNAEEYAAEARKRDGPMTKQGLTALGRVLAGIGAGG